MKRCPHCSTMMLETRTERRNCTQVDRYCGYCDHKETDYADIVVVSSANARTIAAANFKPVTMHTAANPRQQYYRTEHGREYQREYQRTYQRERRSRIAAQLKDWQQKIREEDVK